MYVRSIAATTGSNHTFAEHLRTYFGAAVLRLSKACLQEGTVDYQFDQTRQTIQGLVAHEGRHQVDIGLADWRITHADCSCFARTKCKHTLAVICKYYQDNNNRSQSILDICIAAAEKLELELERKRQHAIETEAARRTEENTQRSLREAAFRRNRLLSRRKSNRRESLRAKLIGGRASSPSAPTIRRKSGKEVVPVIPHIVLTNSRGAVSFGGRFYSHRKRPRIEITFHAPDGQILSGPEIVPTEVDLGKHSLHRVYNSEIVEKTLDFLKGHGFEKADSLNSGATTCSTTVLMTTNPSSWIQLQALGIKLLKFFGCEVKIDESFQIEIVKARGPVKARVQKSSQENFSSLDLFVPLDGSKVSILKPLTACLENHKPGDWYSAIEEYVHDGNVYLILEDGRFLEIPLQQIQAVLPALIETLESNADSLSELLLKPKQSVAKLKKSTGPVDLDYGEAAKAREFMLRIDDASTLPDIQVPTSFLAKLRDYQVVGVKWLQSVRAKSLGGILADDMGLGKTIQSLAHIAVERESGSTRKPFLVVCPTSVLPNWLSEAQKWCPHLKVLAYSGTQRYKHLHELASSDIVVCSYSLVLRDIDLLASQYWNGIILDEAQAIKNATSLVSKAVRRLRASHRIALTGTPVENHLTDLWSIFQFLRPGMLGSQQQFRKTIDSEDQNDKSQLQTIASNLRPFVLRRTKAVVEKDLPPKSVIIKRIELTGKQRVLYESVRCAANQNVLEQVASKGFNNSRITILSALLRMRQVCCAPQLLPGLKSQGFESAKVNALAEMLPEMIDSGRKILLFSQFTSMLDLLKPELNKLGIPFVELAGDTKDRATPVQRFQSGEVPLFLISLKAGGTGLNLTAADTVIHFDPWWNPAVENQATDRAHRIGQTKAVFVYKLIASGTVEEKVLNLQQKKAALLQTIVGHEDDITGAIDEDDLCSLFAP